MKKRILVFGLFLFLIFNIGCEKANVTRINNLELISIEQSNYEEDKRFFHELTFKPVVPEEGVFYYSRSAKIINLSDDNHLYNIEDNRNRVFFEGESNELSSNESIKLILEDLINGKYKLEVTAYTSNPDIDGEEYKFEIEFEVKNSVDTLEQYTELEK